jgi:hypothetical protein
MAFPSNRLAAHVDGPPATRRRARRRRPVVANRLRCERIPRRHRELGELRSRAVCHTKSAVKYAVDDSICPLANGGGARQGPASEDTKASPAPAWAFHAAAR